MLLPFLALALMQSPPLQTGASLYVGCKDYIAVFDKTRTIDESGFFDAGVCIGFVRGLATGLDSKGDACSQAAQPVTIVRVFLRFMDENPKLMDESDTKALSYALHFGYPCEKK